MYLLNRLAWRKNGDNVQTSVALRVRWADKGNSAETNENVTQSQNVAASSGPEVSEFGVVCGCPTLGLGSTARKGYVPAIQQAVEGIKTMKKSMAIVMVGGRPCEFASRNKLHKTTKEHMARLP